MSAGSPSGTAAAPRDPADPDPSQVRPGPRLRSRLLRLSVLPVLAVGAMTALVAGVSLQREAEQGIVRGLEQAVRETHDDLADIAARLAGYGIVIAQRRDLQEAFAANDRARIQRELTVLFWDLRSNDPLLTELALLGLDGQVAAIAGRPDSLTNPGLPDPTLLDQALQGDQVLGLMHDPGRQPMLGALVPIVAASSGDVVGVVQTLVQPGAALARELSQRLRDPVALFLDGELIASTLPLDGKAMPAWLTEAVARGGSVAGALDVGAVRYRVMTTGIAASGGTTRLNVAILRPAPPLRDSLTRASVALALAAAALLFIALPLVWSAARRLARPLEELADTLRRLEGGEVDATLPRLPARSPVEIAVLADAVARLQASLAERDELSGRLAWMANFDSVTQVPNRNLFNDRLAQALAVARRTGNQVALLLIDLDRFKAVNDTMGHAAGDTVLRTVGERLSSICRSSDTVARLGGDEFAMILPNVRSPEDCAMLAERVIESLSKPIPIGAQTAEIGASVGIALSLGLGRDPAEVLQREADLALYRSKNEGRGCFRIFDGEMDQQARDRRTLQADLRIALERGQFRLVFQPQFALPDRTPCGAEVLLRWRHPERGDVPPDLFIRIAEQSGLILPIGAWVLHEAARASKRWPSLSIAANVSPIQLRQPDFLDTVRAAIADAGAGSGRLEIEVTEGAMLTEAEATILLFDELRALGVRIALDDFGNGYSSLAQLQRFRFDKIKLDRAFVHPLGRSPTSTTLLRAVVGMTRALGVRLNAEGVELEEQLAELAAEGCAEVQGYLLARPMEFDEFDAFVRANATLSSRLSA